MAPEVTALRLGVDSEVWHRDSQHTLKLQVKPALAIREQHILLKACAHTHAVGER
jgi:hypothetical protein